MHALRLVTQRSETREPARVRQRPCSVSPDDTFLLRPLHNYIDRYMPLHSNTDRYTHPCTPIPSDPTDPTVPEHPRASPSLPERPRASPSVPERPRASPSLPSAVVRRAAQYTR